MFSVWGTRALLVLESVIFGVVLIEQGLHLLNYSPESSTCMSVHSCGLGVGTVQCICICICIGNKNSTFPKLKINITCPCRAYRCRQVGPRGCRICQRRLSCRPEDSVGACMRVCLRNCHYSMPIILLFLSM